MHVNSRAGRKSRKLTTLDIERIISAMDTLAECLLILDEEGRIVLANRPFAELVGRETASLVGLLASEFDWKISESDQGPKVHPWTNRFLDDEFGAEIRVEVKTPANGLQKLHGSSAPVQNRNGKLIGRLVVFDDEFELARKNNQVERLVETLEDSWAQIEKKNKELHYLATKDPLTNILNRRAFSEQFEVELQKVQSKDYDLSCIMTDIDHFKAVNDTFGHRVGDEVLKMFADIMRSNIREHDLLGRLGGDEFCIVLPEIGLEDAISVAERIRKCTKDISEKTGSKGFRITTSFGVASLIDQAKSAGELSIQADRSLYVAKERGRNRVVSWHAEFGQETKPATHSRSLASLPLETVQNTEAQPKAEAADWDNQSQAGQSEVEQLQIRIRQLEDIAGKYSRELDFKSNYDSLTGLPNQILFYDRIRQAIIQGRRYDQIIGVLTLDIRLFKRVNNALGREAGDLLLKKVAGRLKGVLRRSDVVALLGSKSPDLDLTVSRLNADEFGVLLNDLNNQQVVTWIVKRIFESLAKPIIVQGQKIFVNCNIGISLCPDDGDTAEVLLNHAIAARQYAKQLSGQNNYQIYDEQMHEISLTQMRIDTELRRAIENDEFELYYQPKVDLKSSTFNGVEALIRWNHPRRGLLLPHEFIEVAEQSGLIIQIGEWVIREACLQARAWLNRGISPVKIAVNLSTLQLRQENFSDRILGILREAELSPQHIELEITETVIMDNLQTAVNTLTSLHDHGFRISIDDFGTGYSSLNYLKHLPLDTIKIDRSFLQDILSDHYDKTIVKTIIAMAHSMNLSVTAEGVETREQLDLLQQYACDEIQGYLFSRPVPPAETTKLLNEAPDFERCDLVLPSA